MLTGLGNMRAGEGLRITASFSIEHVSGGISCLKKKGRRPASEGNESFILEKLRLMCQLGI